MSNKPVTITHIQYNLLVAMIEANAMGVMPYPLQLSKTENLNSNDTYRDIRRLKKMGLLVIKKETIDEEVEGRRRRSICHITPLGESVVAKRTNLHNELLQRLKLVEFY